jgi:3-oxoadipate enol-lactonase
MFEMPKVVINDIEINYHEEGKGFPLILIHGLSDDSGLWTPLMPAFSRKYRTIALDLRGHGLSGKPDMPYSIQQFSEDLFEVLQKLEIPRTHLLGLSMGGAIAQQFALEQPKKVRSLILLSTFGSIDPDLRDTLKRLRNSLIQGGCPAFFDGAVKLIVTAEFAAANADEIAMIKEEMVKMNSPTALVHAIDACMEFNVEERLPRISLPTLILSGRADIFTPIHFSEQIHRSIQGSKWKILEDVGHNLLIPEKIPELSQLVLEFLATHTIP